jgi:hypothetical protein
MNLQYISNNRSIHPYSGMGMAKIQIQGVGRGSAW